MAEESKKVAFFAEHVDFEVSDNEKLAKSRNGWRAFGIGGWCLAGAAIVAVIPLATLHEYIPVPITVDKQTGTYEVHAGRQTIDIHDANNERQMAADIARYVKAREGFTRGEADSNYKLVWWNSAKALRGSWDAEFKPDLNPQAKLNRFTPTDKQQITDLSLSFLPTDSDEYRAVQVRYSVEEHIGAGQPTVQRKVSNLTYRYDASNIPRDIEGLTFNAFGMTVLNYRSDPEGPKRPLVTGPQVRR